MKYTLVESKNPRTEEPMFYASAAPVNVVKLATIATEISQNCTVTPHDIRAVISALEERIIGHLQQGHSVRLGLLGSFRPTVRSRSAKTPLEFTNKNITGIGVVFTQSSTMKFKLGASNPEVSFERLVEKKDGEVSYN